MIAMEPVRYGWHHVVKDITIGLCTEIIYIYTMTLIFPPVIYLDSVVRIENRCDGFGMRRFPTVREWWGHFFRLSGYPTLHRVSTPSAAGLISITNETADRGCPMMAVFLDRPGKGRDISLKRETFHLIIGTGEGMWFIVIYIDTPQGCVTCRIVFERPVTSTPDKLRTS